MNVLTRIISLIKIIIVFAAVGSLIGFTVSSAAAQSREYRWYQIGIDAEGKRFFIDMYSVINIEVEEPLRLIWTKVLYPDGSYVLDQNQWDCKNKRFRVIKSVIYSPQGSYLGEEKLTKKWSGIPPESVAERFGGIICFPVVLDEQGNPVFGKEATSLKNDRLGNPDEVKTDGGKLTKAVQVIVKSANVRKLPSMNEEVISRVRKGKIFSLTDAAPAGGWYQIVITDEKGKYSIKGWIHGNTIKFVEAEGEN